MGWRVELSATATRQLSKLERVEAARITRFLRERVVGDPRASGKALSGPLGGLWRYRIGDYRVVCEIQDAALRVLVVTVGNRREVYR